MRTSKSEMMAPSGQSAMRKDSKLGSIVSRAEHGLWFAFLATFAFQSRYIFWQADTLFIEWRSASVYLSDVLLVGLLVFAVIRLLPHRMRETADWTCAPWDYALAAFVAVAALTFIGTEHRGVSLYGFTRLVQGVVLYAYVRWYVPARFDRDLSLAAFVLGAVAQSSLGIAQFLLQRHVGLHTLGETLLHPNMRGVAVFYDLAGVKTLRAYGTMPHPNVLAIQLVLGMSVLWYLYLRHSAATVRQSAWAWFGLSGVLVWGFLSTFSRTVVAGATVALAVPLGMLLHERTSRRWLNAARLRHGVRNILIVVLVGSVLFGALFWPQVLARAGISPHEEAVQLRSFDNTVALRSGEGLFGINWLGAGIGNFVTWLMRSSSHLPSWQYQPAHNLYLLVYTEMGVLGLSAFAAFMILVFIGLVRRRTDEPLVKWGLVSLTGLILFAAMFDHFFWTLQQGRVLFWLFWGVVSYYAGRNMTAGTH